MRKLPVIFLLLISGFFSGFASEENVLRGVRNVSIRDGLSVNAVLDITQDSEGFIWIATSYGLNRYDGRSIDTFLHDENDQNSLSGSNYVLCIHEDQNETLWVGTSRGGLNRYDRQKDEFEHFFPNPNSDTVGSNSIWGILEVDGGIFWIGSDGDGLRRFDPKTGVFETYKRDPNDNQSLACNSVRAVLHDSRHRIWVGTKTGGLGLFSEQTERFENFAMSGEPGSISSNQVHSILEYESGQLWVGTNEGLEVFDVGRRSFSKKEVDPNSPELEIHALTKDRRGNVWLGTNAGVYKYDPTAEAFASLSEDYRGLEFAEQTIRVIYEGRDGLLWFGSNEEGVYIYDPTPIPFHNHSIAGVSSDAPDTQARSFAEDPLGRIVVGTVEGGLFFFDRQTHQFSSVLDVSSTGSNITKLKTMGANELFVGTWGQGLRVLDLNLETGEYSVGKTYVGLDFTDDAQKSIVMDFYRDSRGLLWIGTADGLWVYDETEDYYHFFEHDPQNANSLSNNSIQSNCLLEDEFGHMWIGTWNGLNRVRVSYDSETLELDFERFLKAQANNPAISGNKVVSITQGSEGLLWVGTFGDGLNKVSYSSLRGEVVVESFNKAKHGLANDSIYTTIIDEAGNLWISTNDGISRFDAETEVISNFRKEDGLLNNIYFWAAGFRANDGEIFFGGIGGISRFYPKDVEINSQSPDVSFVRMATFKANQKTETPIRNGDSITLSYLEDIVQIDFAALDFHDPEKNNYAYRILENGSEWTFLDEGRLTFFNPKPQRYTIEIKASNTSGIWSDDTAFLYLKVLPPYWETWWFRICIVALILLGIVVYLRFRIHFFKRLNGDLSELNTKLIAENKHRLQVEKSLVEAKTKAEEANRLKSEFLAQVSHEIRTPLHGILSFSEFLTAELDQKISEELKDTFSLIKKSGKRLSRTIDLLLNISQIQADAYQADYRSLSLVDVVNDLSAELKHQAYEKNLEFEILNNAENPAVNADAYTCTQLFANLIENAIKYTEFGHVRILFENSGSNLVVRISDTGIGMSEAFKERLFEPFSQEDTGDTRQYEGTGLGMTLVRKYCEINRATIEVETEKNVGTTFELSFAQELQ